MGLTRNRLSQLNREQQLEDNVSDQMDAKHRRWQGHHHHQTDGNEAKMAIKTMPPSQGLIAHRFD